MSNLFLKQIENFHSDDLFDIKKVVRSKDTLKYDSGYGNNLSMKRKIPFWIVLCVLFGCIKNADAQEQKRLYIANDDHTDYMWAGTDVEYNAAFVKMLDFYLNAIDASKNKPDDFQMRFNCDGNYWLRTYQKFKSPNEFQRLIKAVKSGHISVPLNSVVSTFGAQPAEAVIRGMYYGGKLERQYHLKLTLASAMENNTLPLGLSSLWAGSGAKYSWRGVGGYGSQFSYPSRAHHKYQLYNYTGKDESSLLMKWYPLGAFGNYAECRLNTKIIDSTADNLKKIIQKLDAFCDTDSSSSYPYKIAGAFGFGHDNVDTYVAQPFIDAAEQESNSSRKVRISNEEDFFLDVAKTYPNLPSESVSFGNEWDILCASMNETTAEVKRATEKLRSAEAMATIVSLHHPDFMKQFSEKKEKAWDAFGLYWEHNWTADGPIGIKPRAEWQIKIKDQIVEYVDSLYNHSKNTLSNQIKSVEKNQFYVFNPLSWSRNDIADIPFNLQGDDFRIFDVVTKQSIPFQKIEKEGKSYLRFQAKGVPSVGYKVYQFEKGNAVKIKSDFKISKNTVENQFYKLTLSPSGAITQLIDKKAGNKSILKKTNGLFLNDLGSNDVNDGMVTLENVGPISVTLKATSPNPVLHTVRVTMYKDIARIDIENTIDENFKDTKTWTFSFDVKNSITHHEEVGAVLNVNTEHNGGDYSDHNARYDWQTFNHFLDISNDHYGISISNLDCSFFKLGNSTKDSLYGNSSQIHALAGGRIDKKVEDQGILGVPDQFGQKIFKYHFAITSHALGFNPTSSMKFAMAHQNPLIVGTIDHLNTKGVLPNHFSFVQLDNPNVLLWSLKPAEDGMDQGVISRYWNLTDSKVAAKLHFYTPIKQAWQTSHIETDLIAKKPILGNLSTNFNPQQIKTYRVKLKQ